MAGRGPAVQVTGAKELRRALKNLDGGVQDLKDANREAGEIVADEARTLVPVDTGDLRSSIRPDRRQNGSNILAGGRSAPYAGPIHFGWARRNIEPDPFLYDAIDRRATEVRDAYAKQMDRLIHRVDREFP